MAAIRSVYADQSPSMSIEPCDPTVQNGCMKVFYNGRFASTPQAADPGWVMYDNQGQLTSVAPPATYNSDFGAVIFEADRYLKSASQGTDNLSGQPFVSGVPGFVSELNRMATQAASNPSYSAATVSDCLIKTAADRTRPSSCHRMWFTPGNQITVRIAADGHSLVFDPVTIRTEARFVRFTSSGEMVDVPGNDPAVAAFSDFFNTHYDEFAAQKPELARLI